MSFHLILHIHGPNTFQSGLSPLGPVHRQTDPKGKAASQLASQAASLTPTLEASPPVRSRTRLSSSAPQGPPWNGKGAGRAVLRTGSSLG